MSRRRTKAQVEALEREILLVLEEDSPISVRHIFYRLTDPRLPEPVEKSEHGYAQVQSRVVGMRRAGLIPYGSISDSTRRGYHVATYGSAAEALRHWTRSYRANLWQDADVYVEVWCESRSIAGVIQDLCRELAVSLYPSGGFTSLTLAHDAALGINAATNDGEFPARVIYIGDYDPAGVLIDLSIESEIRNHLHPDIDMEFRRLAVTEEQIASMSLPVKPRKRAERRARHVEQTVEAEAIPAQTLRSMLKSEIEVMLPPGSMAATIAAEESERRMILWAANNLEAS